MKRRLKDVKGFHVHATDGIIGHVTEFYFDDALWNIRYVVVGTGKWLSGRKVLIAPQSVRALDMDREHFVVDLSQEQIKNSPDVDTDKPVARQHEVELNQHYGWEVYWGSEALIANPDIPVTTRGQDVDENKGGKPFDIHLRTTRVVTGFHVEAEDGRIGHVEDFVFDDETWTIERVVVDTRNWLPSKKVQIPPDLVHDIRVEEKLLSVRATREQIREMPDIKSVATVPEQAAAG